MPNADGGFSASVTHAAPSVRQEYFRPQRKIRMLAHGVTMNAMASEKNIAALEPMGIGRM